MKYWASIPIILSIMSLLLGGRFVLGAATVAHKTVLLDVPFTAQAPLGNWKDPRQQHGCEEASVLMALRWARGKTLFATQAQQQILAMADWEQKKYGNYVDTSAIDTAERLVKKYAGYENVSVRYDIGVQDIKDELDNGNVVVAPMNGRLLKNPYFKRPGPLQHMLLIRGYDNTRGEFITNDPGTRRGKGYRYPYAILMGALRDYPTGNNEEIKNVRTAMIVIKKISP